MASCKILELAREARACYVKAMETKDPAEATDLFSRSRACLSEIEQIVLQKPPARQPSWVRPETEPELGTAKVGVSVGVK